MGGVRGTVGKNRFKRAGGFLVALTCGATTGGVQFAPDGWDGYGQREVGGGGGVPGASANFLIISLCLSFAQFCNVRCPHCLAMFVFLMSEASNLGFTISFFFCGAAFASQFWSAQFAWELFLLRVGQTKIAPLRKAGEAAHGGAFADRSRFEERAGGQEGGT